MLYRPQLANIHKRYVCMNPLKAISLLRIYSHYKYICESHDGSKDKREARLQLVGSGLNNIAKPV